MDLVQLTDRIVEYFNLDDLGDLCFRLGIPFDGLDGTNLNTKARSLTEFCRRHGRLEELIRKCRELRPNGEWPEFQPQKTDPNAPPEGQIGIMPGAIPASSAPQVPGMFWMPYPNTWYGPFNGYYIGWLSFGGFQVWHPFYGLIPYPDPFLQFQRNMWVRLINSPFNVYVDGGPNGYVFGQFSG